MSNHLDINTLETWLWDAAYKISGPIDAPKYKDYIMPLIFLKRLSDVFGDELQRWYQKLKLFIKKWLEKARSV